MRSKMKTLIRKIREAIDNKAQQANEFPSIDLDRDIVERFEGPEGLGGITDGQVHGGSVSCQRCAGLQ